MKHLSTAEYVASKYNEFVVREEMTLMDFLSVQMHGISRNRLKDIMKGHGVTVDRKLVTQYNYPLQPGMLVSVSKHRHSTELSSKWIKIIYEDKDIIVIGIYYYNDGSRYEGDFRNDKLEGKGIMFYNDGEIYMGDWRNGKKEGKGIYYYNNGDREMGDWSNDKEIGKHVILTNKGEVEEQNY